MSAPHGFVDNEEEFVVESILGVKEEHGKILYLIKWQGYDEDENTWETRDDLLIDGHREAVEVYERMRSTPKGGGKSSNKGSRSKTPVKRTTITTTTTTSTGMNGNTGSSSAPYRRHDHKITSSSMHSSSLYSGIMFCTILTVLISLSIMANKVSHPMLENEAIKSILTLSPFLFCGGVLAFKRPDSTSFNSRALGAVLVVTILAEMDCFHHVDEHLIMTTRPILNALWSFFVLRATRSHLDPARTGMLFDVLVCAGLVVSGQLPLEFTLSAITTLCTWTFAISALVESLLRVQTHKFSVLELVQLAGVCGTLHGAGQLSKTWDWKSVDRWMSCVAFVVVALSLPQK